MDTSPFVAGMTARNDSVGRVLRLAFVGRTSTEDQQDPTISIPRQVRTCQSVLGEDAVIVAYFYDVESGRGELSSRGRGTAHERMTIPVRRDGGIQDLLAEAQRPDRRFNAVVCESVDRIARRTLFGLQIEHTLEQAGLPLLAADEPAGLSQERATHATRVLTRRIKQGVAESLVNKGFRWLSDRVEIDGRARVRRGEMT